ncbi:hypothetical protein RQP46_008257 [Phenoliferia psychrophenolica]
MRAMSYDLERKYHDDKQRLQEENSRLQDDNLRLRRDMDTSARHSGPPPPSSRPSLPALSSAGRPTSSHSHHNNSNNNSNNSSSNNSNAPQVGHGSSNLFGGATSLPPGSSGGPPPPSSSGPGEAGPYGNGGGGRGRDEGEMQHPNKRMRPADEDEPMRDGRGERERGPMTPMGGKGKPELSRPNPSFPTKSGQNNNNSNSTPLSSSLPPTPSAAPPPPVLSRPPSTNPSGSGPPLHHPMPVPLPLPPITTTGTTTSTSAAEPEQPRPPFHQQSSAEQFDPETVTRDLKKEGSDWMTMFNPNVKRVLDVGLVHTLVHDSVVCCVKFSPDGKILATGCNRNTTLYDTKTGAKISVLFDDSAGTKADNYIRSASFSPDGKLLATGSEDRAVRIWNIAQKRISKVFQGHKSEIYSLAFSPDGKRLVSGSGDKTARIWDMDTGTCVYTLSIEQDVFTDQNNGPIDAGVTSVVMSPDGKYLAAGSLDTVVRIWDAASGKLLDKLKGHKDSVYSVAFSPDGHYLVSGSLDKTLKMWDMSMVNRGADASDSKVTCMTTLQGHKDYVLSVAISPDGAWIVSGSKDRGVQFWDPTTARAQFMLQGHKNSVISVAVSDVGNLVATGSGDWSARIWSYERIA